MSTMTPETRRAVAELLGARGRMDAKLDTIERAIVAKIAEMRGLAALAKEKFGVDLPLGIDEEMLPPAARLSA